MQTSVLLRPREPFSFTRTLRFILSPPALLNGRQFAPLLDYFEDGEYRRLADIQGQPVLYGVSERQTFPATLRVRILAGPAGPHASDRVLAKLLEHFRGMRIPQATSVYETLVSAILEQQVNLTFAHQVKKALIETYGKSVEYEGRRYNAFPEPAALAIATPRELRRLQISGPKARYIIGISRATLDGALDLEGLRSVEPAVARARLLEHKGVGPWTAHYVGLRALGHLDCLPAADVGLQKAIQIFYGLRQQPPVKKVEALARKWSGWRSYATFYLWLTFWEEPAWRDSVLRELKAEQRA